MSYFFRHLKKKFSAHFFTKKNQTSNGTFFLEKKIKI